MSPKVLIDITKNRGISPFHKSNQVINLSQARIISFPIKLAAKFFLTLLFFVYLLNFLPFFESLKLNGLAMAPTIVAQTEEKTENAQAKRQALEAELAEYEKQIDEYESSISSLKKQGKSLSSEIKQLDAKVAKLNVQIKAVSLNLKKLDEEIGATQKEIELTENDVDFNKRAISKTLQDIYKNERKGLLAVLLASPKLSDFFGDLNDLLTVQESLKIELVKIIELRDKLVDEKEALALQKADAEDLKKYRFDQKDKIESTKSEKDDILKKTKGKESEYQKLLVETKKTAAEIRKQIFKMLGGGELSFEEAYQLAKFAESATGVRAALLLAVLDRESALGKNVGRCGYKTAMHPTRDIPIFLEIVQKLNLDPNSVMVSCANADGAYGGAMGPAQFIPSTWRLYENKIAEITGSNPPSPWKNSDAFAATALYLKDAGAGEGASLAQERKAAAKYYAGSRWSRYLWTYGAKVITQAKKFEDDIAILSG